MKAFRNYHYTGSNDDWCNTEFTIMQVNIQQESKTQGMLSWADLFKTQAFRKRLFVGSFVWAAAMLSGISFVQYYQTAYVTAPKSRSCILIYLSPTVSMPPFNMIRIRCCSSAASMVHWPRSLVSPRSSSSTRSATRRFLSQAHLSCLSATWS